MDFKRPKIMGILNISKDSFFDGGKYSNIENALKQTEKMLSEGADIIDIGSFSTRPGASLVSIKEERGILIPILSSLIDKFPKTLFSIDTFQSEIAKEALSIGASMINDISGGTYDSKMMEVISEHQVPYCIMHIQGKPLDMQIKPLYKNVVIEVLKYFSDRLEKAHSYGINNIIIDPGFGFGKTINHNYELFKNLSLFKQINCPILIGVSRKSMIYKTLGTTPEFSLNGTSILHTYALLKGANILRVHDVKEAKECLLMCELMH